MSQATEGAGSVTRPDQARSRVRSRGSENYPAPPFHNTSPTGLPPKGQLYPDLPPPDLAACRG